MPAWTCLEDQSATSTSPAWLADIADTKHCWRSTTAACFASPPFVSLAGRPFAADASAGSIDAGACSARAAVRTADFDGGFDSDGATAADSESSDSSPESRCPFDAAAPIDRVLFVLARLGPETANIHVTVHR